MMNRISNRLTARFVAIAALLALVMAAPAVFAQENVSYEEGDTEPVATFDATDQDGDPIVWSLSGADAKLFTIDGGVLAFKKSPDYESPGDTGKDNIYDVTVNASGGTTDVVVTVTNVDEMGTVDIDDLQPQAGESVGAEVDDQDSDSLEQITWQWSKSMSDDGPWEAISGATSQRYTPVDDDIGYFLQATAEYSDGIGAGRDSASGVTLYAVEERPLSNAQPKFADDTPVASPTTSEQERSVRETAKPGDSVGNAVTASDADNDPLLYELTGATVAFTTVPTAGPGVPTIPTAITNSDALFRIDPKSGQISLKGDANTRFLNFEEYATTNADTGATPPVARALEYTVTVKAIDPSGSEGTVTVTIKVAEVNEAPVIEPATTDLADRTIPVTRVGGKFVFDTPEEETLDLNPEEGSSADFSGGLPVFDADDPEDPTGLRIIWTISGPDAKRFQIAEVVVDDTDAATFGDPEPNTSNANLADVDSSAALRWADGEGPSFEDMDSADGDNVYELTVTAFDGVAGQSQAVSIEVRNEEEAGSVTLSQLTPQVGRAITASLTDPDKGITGATWQWYRGGPATDADTPANGIQQDEIVTLFGTLGTTGENAGKFGDKCDPDAATPVTANCWIDGATSSTYTPVTADTTGGGTASPPVDAQRLTAVVMYTDTVKTDVRGGTGTDPNFDDPISTTNPANADDKDDGDMVIVTTQNAATPRPNQNAAPSFGDDESVDRSVAENANKENVGEPVTANDGDGDSLLYSLSGDGSDAFSVDRTNGQIRTAKKLDFETQSSYSITLTATDPSGASDSITVNIEVTDADDPAVISTTASVSYEEGGTGPVATFTADDQDGDAIVWSLGGPDAADFTIAGGVLAFKKSPNYEGPADEGRDNIYDVTVRASGGTTDVVVMVTNVDEMGTVDIDDLQPQAGESVGAEVDDQDSDSLEQITWQWSKSMAEDGPWSPISGATSQRYTPVDDDIGYFLQATAEYSDGLGEGRDSASAVTLHAVEERPLSNARPKFADDTPVASPTTSEQERSVRETAKPGDSVGNAVTASDADNDPLLYELTGVETTFDVSPTGAATTADSDDLFRIDPKSGQISLKSDVGLNADGSVTLLNIEAYAGNAVTGDTASTLGTLEYVVTVKAIDPSGSEGTVTVTIKVAAVNEAPTIEPGADLADRTIAVTRLGGKFVFDTPEEKTLDLDAEDTTSNNFSGATLPVFDADDPETPAARIIWTISGPDARRFEIAEIVDADGNADPNTDPAGVDSSAALRWADGEGPSFEDMDSADGDNVYDLTVTAFDGVASRSQPVSIEVRNEEEPGSITLSQLTPQVGRAITASLNDPDKGVTGATWKWYRGVADDNGTAGIQEDELPADTALCTATLTADCVIEGATSSTYTPVTADTTGGGTASPPVDAQRLTVVVRYTDTVVTRTSATDSTDVGDIVIATTANAAQARPNQNAAPTFGDDESVDRSVEENAKGANVGEPVTATDGDSDALLYTLSGDGSGDFSVNRTNGQISTKKALDYETTSSYSITLTATDPSGASDSITVNITVTDADDGATVILLTGNAPEFDSAEMTRSVAENTDAGMAIGDPVAATDVDGDALTYTLGGDDADAFTIDSMGQLMTSAALDYETKMSYTVTVTASSGKADEVDAMTTVTIMVTDEGLDNAYDLNENGAIERDEVIAAIQDYLGGNTSRSEVTELIRLYFGEDG